jgi:hypothetical protein
MFGRSAARPILSAYLAADLGVPVRHPGEPQPSSIVSSGLRTPEGPRFSTLPGPFAPGVRVLAGERRGELDPAGAVPEVALVLCADVLDLAGQRRLDRRRQHGHAVLVAPGAPDHDLIGGEVDVLDAQAAAFEQGQP